VEGSCVISHRQCLFVVDEDINSPFLVDHLRIIFRKASHAEEICTGAVILFGEGTIEGIEVFAF